MDIANVITNNLNNSNILKEGEQTNFLETTLGKTINFGLDIGLRALLPDYVEQSVIDIKDTILQNGFTEGVKKIVSSAIDFGKSALGIVTGNFDNMSQIQTVIKNGGIIDGVSDLVDNVLNKTTKSGKLSINVANAIKNGKDVILNSVTSKLEDEFNNQLNTAEKLQKYTDNWKSYFNDHNFEGMQREYEKIKDKLKMLVPMESTIKQARIIENLHTLIKNNGQDFNLTKEQTELANMLT